MPQLAKSQLPKWVAEHTNGSLSIGDIRFQPLSWRLQVDQLQLNDDQGQAAFTLQQAVVNLEPWRSLFGLRGQLHQLQLNKPSVTLVERNGELNVVTLFAPLLQADPNAEPASPAASNKPLPLAIDQFALTAGAISYQRQDQPQPLTASQLNLQGQQLNFAGADNQLQLSLRGPNGGELNLQLSSQFTPLNIAADIRLSALQLAPIWQFIQPPVAVELNQGALALNSQIILQQPPAQGQQAQPLQLKVRNTDILFTELALSQTNSTAQPLLNVDQLAFTGLQLAWPQQQVQLDSIALQGGQANASLETNGLSWLQLLPPAPPAATAAAAPASTDSAPWQLLVRGVSIDDWRVNLTDNTAPAPAQWQLDLQQWRAAPLSSDLTQPITLALASRLNDSASIQFDGQLLPQDLTLQSSLSVQDFNLLDTLPYWQQQLALKLNSGSANIDGELELISTEPLDLRFTGNAAINQLHSQDPQGQRDLLKWQQLAFNGIGFGTQPMALRIDSIDAVHPYARIIVDEDGSTNLSQLGTEAEQNTEAATATAAADSAAQTATAAPSAPAELPLTINIGAINLQQGSAFFADNSLTPKFATGIEQINGRIGSLSSEFAQPAQVDINGQVDRYAPMSLKGELQPFGAQRQLDLGLNFNNIELTSLNPYSGTYAGYFIDQGQLNLGLNYQLDGNKLNGNNKVVLNQLKLGKRSDSEHATSLPVALAIALMQDSNGVIDLELAISGNVDDPQFAIGPLVLQALGNLITKAVTAPFALLGNLLGGEPPAEFVQFAPGTVVLTEQAQTELKRLASALEQRPKLSLTVAGAIAPAADKHALAQQALSSQLGYDVSQLTEPAQWQQLEQLAQAQLAAEVLAELKQQLPQPEQYQNRLREKLLETQPITDAALAQLALQRAANTKQLLVEQAGLPPERVFVKETRVELDTRGARVHLALGSGG
ncbi:DUF748 domain-containing protein [uncultured Ferrimonas sp.]|uniref:DUF748 domain-containing protein n=1 Tax=uncultured Ferrimonas sp. TaxID=432640 RepID=UPI002614869C|nr:DUF748 domain-containing protein [uncultured Ferrimonas sp.]